MKTRALQSLLLSLEATATMMNETGEEMKDFETDHPNLFKHGCEMVGAARMVEDWINGINEEEHIEKCK